MIFFTKLYRCGISANSEIPFLHTLGAAKSQIAGRTIFGVLGACSAAIAIAIGLVAQVGAALLHPIGTWAGVAGLPQIRGPFPDVADNVIQIVVVLTELINGASEWIAILLGVAIGKVTLPYVQPVLVLRHKFVAPGKELPLLAATASNLPLCFARQSFARPFTIGNGVAPANVHNWVMLQA